MFSISTGNDLDEHFYFSNQIDFIETLSDSIRMKFDFALHMVGDATAPKSFQKLVFYLSNTEIMSIDYSGSSIEFDKIGNQIFSGFVPPSDLPFTGKFHLVSFPIGTSSENHTFVPSSIYFYHSITSSAISYPGMYLAASNGFSYFRVCGEMCVKCVSLLVCSVCDEGHYLSHGQCLPCSADCRICADHARKCLICSKNPTQTLTGTVDSALANFKKSKSIIAVVARTHAKFAISGFV